MSNRLIPVVLAAALTGCYKTNYTTGASTSTDPKEDIMHHRVIWGIAELPGPVNIAEVCPSAEDTARTGQDHGLHFVVSLDCMDGFQEIISRLLVKRVPLLWAVDSEVGDLAFDFEIDAGFHDTHSGLSAAQTSTNTV